MTTGTAPSRTSDRSRSFELHPAGFFDANPALDYPTSAAAEQRAENPEGASAGASTLSGFSSPPAPGRTPSPTEARDNGTAPVPPKGRSPAGALPAEAFRAASRPKPVRRSRVPGRLSPCGSLRPGLVPKNRPECSPPGPKPRRERQRRPRVPSASNENGGWFSRPLPWFSRCRLGGPAGGRHALRPYHGSVVRWHRRRETTSMWFVTPRRRRVPTMTSTTAAIDTGDTGTDAIAAPRGLETLSPSRASDFKTCPQLYKFRSIDRIPDPPTESQARGTTAHLALQRLFDLPADERTPDRLFDLFRQAWVEVKDDEFTDLFDDVAVERRWGLESLGILANYFGVEDPTTIEPTGRELELAEQLGDMTIRGILDRMDETDDGLVITDYKSGKAPPERYAIPGLLRPQDLRPAGPAPHRSHPGEAPAAVSQRALGVRDTGQRCPARRHGAPAGGSVGCDRSGDQLRPVPRQAEPAVRLVRLQGPLPGVGKRRPGGGGVTDAMIRLDRVSKSYPSGDGPAVTDLSRSTSPRARSPCWSAHRGAARRPRSR